MFSIVYIVSVLDIAEIVAVLSFNSTTTYFILKF